MLLRRKTTMTMAWVAQRLQMGTKTHLGHLLYWQEKEKLMNLSILRTDPCCDPLCEGPQEKRERRISLMTPWTRRCRSATSRPEPASSCPNRADSKLLFGVLRVVATARCTFAIYMP